jgi:hypothetical protein
MNIGLDYDDTYTRNPVMWNRVIWMMRMFGNKVYIVTWRSESESVEIYDKLGDKVDGVYPTNRQAKEKFMYAQGIRIDVWIDDNPRAIIQDMGQI